MIRKTQKDVIIEIYNLGVTDPTCILMVVNRKQLVRKYIYL